MSDRPEQGKQYRLTGGPGEKCISNGNTWAESEVKEEKDGKGISHRNRDNKSKAKGVTPVDKEESEALFS